MKSSVKYIFLFLLQHTISLVVGQNLIVNPGAELPPIGNGWTESIVNIANPTVPYHWTQANSGAGGVNPHGGTYHFYAGDNSNGNYYIYQDVDVSAYASAIDAGTASFVFSYWFRVYNFNNDRGRVTVEYLNTSNTVLSTYSSGNLNNFFSWNNYSDTRTAPAGTRTIRISLYADRTSGTAADAYFDDLSLTTTAPLPLDLLRFSIQKIHDHIYQANWVVTNEKDVLRYQIAISTDLINWKMLDEVVAKNNNGITSYESDWLVINPTDTFYIQLSEVNTSDAIKVVAQKVVPMSDWATPLIYPNPCTQGDEVNINFNTNYTYEVISITGTLLFKSQEKTIHTTHLSPGMYIIRFAETGHSTQLVIQ